MENLRTTKRRWFKLYPNECINGSIRWQLSAGERGVWYDLLAFSAISSNIGLIADRDGKSLPHSFLANRLNISVSLLETTLKKCADEGRITEDETGIHITNWKIYQSEYDRQLPYRQKKERELKGQQNNDTGGKKGGQSTGRNKKIRGGVRQLLERGNYTTPEEFRATGGDSHS